MFASVSNAQKSHKKRLISKKNGYTTSQYKLRHGRRHQWNQLREQFPSFANLFWSDCKSCL